MRNNIHALYALIGIAVACGEVDLSSQPASTAAKSSAKKESSDAQVSDVQVLKPAKTVESDSSLGSAVSIPSVTLSFVPPELGLHQGESKEIEVHMKSSKPNASVSITPPAQQGLQFDLLTSQGAATASSFLLDAEGKGTFKLKVTSVFQTSPGLVVAPGALNANVELRGNSDSRSFSAALPIKVSNLAFYTMSGVNNVRDLPARFEFPAGTIPVFANPSNRQVAGVLHFQSNTQTQAAVFRHQAVNGSMPMGSGYCPLNTSTSALVTLGAAVNPACLPCPAEATADSQGSFYNHDTENSGQARAIVCKRKI